MIAETNPTIVLPDSKIRGTQRSRFEIHDLTDMSGGRWKAVHIPDKDIQSILQETQSKNGKKMLMDIERDMSSDHKEGQFSKVYFIYILVSFVFLCMYHGRIKVMCAVLNKKIAVDCDVFKKVFNIYVAKHLLSPTVSSYLRYFQRLNYRMDTPTASRKTVRRTKTLLILLSCFTL